MMTQPGWLLLFSSLNLPFSLPDHPVPLAVPNRPVSFIGSRVVPSHVPAQSLVVRHFPERIRGWCVAETPNFRVFHEDSPAFAERAARLAEQMRAALLIRWFGNDGANERMCCDLYLHASGDSFSRDTGLSADLPGYSYARAEKGRVVSQRIDLRCDYPGVLGSVLPHEVTHILMAGRFGGEPIPVWANEGMAILSEPREKIDLHLTHLPRYRGDGQLFAVRELMRTRQYPHRRAMGPFYAQSVSLVEFLTRQQGEAAFIRFVREGAKEGYEKALGKHYGWSLAELEQRWRQHAFEGDKELAASSDGER